MDTATTTADNSDAYAEDDLENHKLQLRESGPGCSSIWR